MAQKFRGESDSVIQFQVKCNKLITFQCHLKSISLCNNAGINGCLHHFINRIDSRKSLGNSLDLHLQSKHEIIRRLHTLDNVPFRDVSLQLSGLDTKIRKTVSIYDTAASINRLHQHSIDRRTILHHINI